jgi:Tol biopolymer transport system component
MSWAQRRRSELATGATALLLAVCGCAGTSSGQQPKQARSTAPSTALPSQSVPLAIGTPVNLGAAVNGPGFDGGPDPSADGLTLYFISDRPGGEGGGDIWVTRRSSPAAGFGPAENLGSVVNTAGNEGAPSVSADGLSIYLECFESDPDGHCHRPDLGDPDIWVATRADPAHKFNAIRNLGKPVNSPSSDGFSDITSDSRTLYFSSDRPGGSGGSDLWRAVRSRPTKPFQTVENLGPEVNANGYDGGPAVSSDGLMLFFASDRPGGFGANDLWVATRTSATDPFGAPVNLGPQVNTPGFEDRPAIGSDGSTLYFMSDRPGGIGSIDIWQVSISPRPT